MSNSVLIVGGGVAGLEAATQCANAGARAVVVEHGAVVGGKLAAAMTDQSSAGDHYGGVPIPKLDALVEQDNIEVMTLAHLESISGQAGDFSVTIRERARFVTDTCTRCNRCRAVCPVVVPNEFDAGLTYRKAIYTPLAQTFPNEYVINIHDCLNAPPNYLPCTRCIDVCDDDSIHFDMPLSQSHEKQVAAIIITVGYEIADDTKLAELGYGLHPDVVTSAELRRLLEAPGPTGGFVSKPSNEEYPRSILLVLDKLSAFSANVAASQIHRLADQDIDKISLLILVQPKADTRFDALEALATEAGIDVCWGMMPQIEAAPDNVLAVTYEDFSSNRLTKREYDMVALCSDVQPSSGLNELAQTVEIDLDGNGYIAATQIDGAGICTSRPGIYVAGCASGPKNVKDSIAEARTAANRALSEMDPRLLQPGYRSGKVTGENGQDLSETALRNQIERMLNALINQGDK